MKALMDTIKARWDAASLDSSIANLYPAGDSPKKGRNPAGSPEGTTLPRAEYTVNIAKPSVKTRSSRIRQALVTFRVWGKDPETVGGYVDSIAAKYLNADELSLSFAGGTILEVDAGSQGLQKLDDALHMGQQLIHIQFREANMVPA